MNLASGIGHRVEAGVELSIHNEELASAANVEPNSAPKISSAITNTAALIATASNTMPAIAIRLQMRNIRSLSRTSRRQCSR